MKTKGLLILGIAIAMITYSCKKDDETVTPDNTDNTDPNATLKSEIKTNYANIVYASYEDAYNELLDLKAEVNKLVSSPSAAQLDIAKQAWLSAREAYGPTEAYRFSGGPIDDEDGPEGLLNAWPLDENYIDYVNGNPNAGIINDLTTYPTIDAQLLESLNEAGGEANISIGYHAIEFLLWGQDDADASLKTSGSRPHTDYMTTGGTASNQQRRGTYLNLAMDLLIDHLKQMVDAWDPNMSGNYRETFMAMGNDKFLQNVLTGVGTLSKSELAGERMFVALDNQDQEDEHSCFSDNTHRDIILNAKGIRNIYLGSYQRTTGEMVEGSSLQDLAAVIDAGLRAEIDVLSAQTISLTEAIPVPFDYALTQEAVGGNGPIMESIRALQDQGDKFVELGAELGITVNTEL